MYGKLVVPFGFFAVIAAAIWLSSGITQRLFVLNGVLTFIVNGVICEAIFCALAFLCCRGIEAERQLEGILLGVVRKRIRKKAQ